MRKVENIDKGFMKSYTRVRIVPQTIKIVQKLNLHMAQMLETRSDRQDGQDGQEEICYNLDGAVDEQIETPVGRQCVRVLGFE